MFKKFLFVVSFLLSGYVAMAQDYPPKSSTLVTDYTNTLSADEKQRLENKLVAFDDSTSTQIAVVIIKSIGDYDINEYGAGLGRKWGIGAKGKNSGILVLVALNDHKMTIQTGYGEEGALPDVIAEQIRVTDMNPLFRAGDYYAGLDKGTDDIIKYTKGEYKADPKKARHEKSGGGSIGFIIIIVIVILILVFRNRGGGGQIIGSRGGASPFWWFLAGSMLGGGGNRGGGGFGGGSSGGGGFGGFGGGDFGGGGSGGSW
ncbi:MAG TPA: TPM domain-containing protein [Mucilaginibacter sp.]